jgi:hypothetical protein
MCELVASARAGKLMQRNRRHMPHRHAQRASYEKSGADLLRHPHRRESAPAGELADADANCGGIMGELEVGWKSPIISSLFTSVLRSRNSDDYQVRGKSLTRGDLRARFPAPAVADIRGDARPTINAILLDSPTINQPVVAAHCDQSSTSFSGTPAYRRPADERIGLPGLDRNRLAPGSALRLA